MERTNGRSIAASLFKAFYPSPENVVNLGTIFERQDETLDQRINVTAADGVDAIAVTVESGIEGGECILDREAEVALRDAMTGHLREPDLDRLKQVLFDLDIAFHVESFQGPRESHSIPGTKNILEIGETLELSFDAAGRYLGSMEFTGVAQEGTTIRTMRGQESEQV